MYVCALLLALHVPGENGPPVWYHDYTRALRQAATADKPLAVFIGEAAKGPDVLCEEGELGSEVRQLLAESYVCVYLDAAHPADRKLIVAFEGGDSPLLVLSDGSRHYQAFRHSGKFANAQLAQVLQQYRTDAPAPPADEWAAAVPCAS